MTIQTFMTQIEGYYGQYPTGSQVKTYVIRYLESDIDASKLPQLLKYLTYSHPVNYGPPDISAIEEAIRNAIKYNKGADVHHIATTDGHEYTPEVTEEEREEAMRLLNAAGGLAGILGNATRKMHNKAIDINGNWS